jgi:multiple sugar transport system substrate-binding protein
MRVSRRHAGGLIAAIALGITGLARADTITLDVIHAWPGQNSFYDQVAQAFTKTHPDIKIQYRASPVSYDEGHQALLRSLITNQLPDVYFSGFHLMPELVGALKKRGRAVPLTPFIEKEGGDWLKANYEPTVLGLGQVGGVQYGMAFNASTPVIFYNGDLVRQAGTDPDKFPRDWKSVLALAAKIGQSGNGVDGMAYDIHAWPDDWLWRALIMEQGAAIMKPDGKSVAFGGQAGLEALEKARSFVTGGTMKLRDYDQSRQQFAAGKIGFIFSSPNGARAFTDLIGNRFPLRSAVFPIANTASGKLPTGGNAAMILSNDKARQQAAWEFIKFATGPDGQKIAVLGSGYMPTNKRALEPRYLGDFYKKNPNWATSLRQIQYANAWAGYPGSHGVQIWRAQRDLIGSVMRGDLSPKEGLARMVSQTNSLMLK